MKRFWVPAVLAALAFVVRFGPLRRAGLDIYIGDRYRVVPLRAIGFWALLAMAAMWFVIGAYRLRRARP